MMNRKRFLLIAVAVLVLVAGLWAGLMVVSGNPAAALQAGAQQPGPWSSSDPPPDGLSPEDLSPPDRPATLSDLDDPEVADPQATWAYLRTAGSALKPRESNVEWYREGGGGCIYASSGSSVAMFNVPIYLPQGAEVNHLRMYYNDTAAATNCVAWFTVYDDYGEVHEEWEISSSGDAGPGYVTTEEFSHTVDYSLYSYVINWRANELGTDMQVCGFLIYYIALPETTYLPAVLSDAP